MPHDDRDARVGWPAATDDRSGRRRVRRCGQQAGAGSWVDGRRRRPRRGRATRTLTFGTDVRASASAPATAPATGAACVAGPPITPLRYQETSSKVTYQRVMARLHDLLGLGRPRRATRRAAGRLVTFRFTGRAVALDRPEGPDPRQREAVRRRRLCHDHQPVSLAVRATDRRRGTVWASSGTHTVKLVAGRDRAATRASTSTPSVDRCRLAGFAQLPR